MSRSRLIPILVAGAVMIGCGPPSASQVRPTTAGDGGSIVYPSRVPQPRRNRDKALRRIRAFCAGPFKIIAEEESKERYSGNLLPITVNRITFRCT